MKEQEIDIAPEHLDSRRDHFLQMRARESEKI